MNIAIFTPNQNPYSETFIQAHKKYLKDTVFYYFGIGLRMQLEGHDSLFANMHTSFLKVKRKVLKSPDHSVWSKAIIQSLKKNKIDRVLVEYGTHAHHLMPVLEKLKIPFVVHFHGYDASRASALTNCDNYQEVFEKANAVIAVSKKMYESLLKLGCPEEKLHYNVYGPQPEFESVQPNFTKKQFIGIGRFTDKKAPYYTVLAFKKILKSYPEAKLLLAGNGPLLNTCKNLVKSFELTNNVKFLGVISPEEFRNYLSESLAFVQHSITADDGDMEGTPLAVLESSVSGLPVISTYHAGIPDVIEHGKTGLICEEHDVAKMSEHMLMVLEDLELAKELGTNGKEHIKSKFNLNRHISKLQEILEKE